MDEHLKAIMKDLEAIKETKTETDVMLLASVSFLFGFGVGLLLGLWWGRFSGVWAHSGHNSEFSEMLTLRKDLLSLSPLIGPFSKFSLIYLETFRDS